MKLVTVTQMREIERESYANGLPYIEMMENAVLNLGRLTALCGISSPARVV